MVHKGFKALVLCGPSGVGKSTLLRRLFDDFPDKFGFSVSHTTRLPRPSEIDGQHYHFISKDEMSAAIEKGEFLESAVFSNNMYGTSKKALDDVVRSGKVCVLDIDVQGVKQIKTTDLKALYVFVAPPSIAALERNLRKRGTESEEELKRRLDASKAEIEYGEYPGNFDLIIVNDIIEKAYSKLRSFITSELEKGSSENVLFKSYKST